MHQNVKSCPSHRVQDTYSLIKFVVSNMQPEAIKKPLLAGGHLGPWRKPACLKLNMDPTNQSHEDMGGS